VATNVGVLFSTALTGWGTYLLLTWLTKNRWAGLIAGVAFAIAPYRLGHITQLHLFTTQWIPFIFLALVWLIKYNRNRDLLLLLIFTNLQFFSVINYAPLVALAAAIWALPFFWMYRRNLSLSLLGRLVVFALITLLLNVPVLRLYQQVSEQMGVVRTLGDAKVYGAYLVNYYLPLGNSLLYGRLLGLPTHLEYQFPGIGIFVSTFPGVIALLLALAALLFSFRLERLLRWVAWAVLLLSLIGFGLSFGANDDAFGPAAAPLVGQLLPYTYLYNFISILQGLRVPIRFALLTVFGVSILAGIGFAALSRQFSLSGRSMAVVASLLCVLIVIEHLPAPLPGVTVPRWGDERTWLRDNTPPDASLIELPYFLHTRRSNEEVLREYESAAHFRWLVNGTSGFKPEWLKTLGAEFDTFPNWQSFDAARRMGIDYVVLHRDQYEPAAWDNITALLPGYLPAIAATHSVGEDLILQLNPPVCSADPGAVGVDARTFPQVSVANSAAATWVADPRRPARLTVDGETSEFFEPLFVLPGESVTFDVPLPGEAAGWQVDLTSLGQTFSADAPVASPPEQPLPDNWQPVQVMFANNASLQQMAVSESPQVCGALAVALRWAFAEYAGETVRVELVDRFGREAIGSESAPQLIGSEPLSGHHLPLPETLPPGQYQLRVRLLSANGDDIPAVSLEGATITEPLTLPIVVRPAPVAATGNAALTANLANNARLVGIDLPESPINPGDWLPFTLYWQATDAIPLEFTVFTQLLGPDGRVVAQQDNPPKGGWYPTSLWRPGDTVADDYSFQVAADAPPGEYRLIVGMYNPASGARVPVRDGGDFTEAGLVVVQ
jgi:hypothetical protein